MKVVLAGYNIDTGVVEEAEKIGVARERMTPEVLSAAYARISRDPRPVGELRRAALEEVEKARVSNRKIIFEMGHHSVAEHAVFNFDVVGISRLAIEWLERFRLCSYTEKSQRYITLDHDFVIPSEISGTPHEAKLLSLVSTQAEIYNSMKDALLEQLSGKYPELQSKKSGRRLLDGWAKEDARYATVLATTGQLGLTANARNLELMIRRFAAAPLEEVRQLGRALFEAGVSAAPSLLLFTEPSSYDVETGPELSKLSAKLVSDDSGPGRPVENVRLVGHTPDPDRVVAAALLHKASNRPFDRCERAVADMAPGDLRKVFETVFKRMQFYDAPPRELEHAVMTFEVTLSSSAFAQLKRHRMTTQSVQGYDPALGLTIPPAVIEIGMAEDLIAHAKSAEELFRSIAEDSADVAAYVLTNAHRRRVLVTTNLRELYHLVRLREDSHAQWDIRNMATEMRALAEEIMPLGTLLLCGKDSYVERYERVFGEPPKITPPE